VGEGASDRRIRYEAFVAATGYQVSSSVGPAIDRFLCSSTDHGSGQCFLRGIGCELGIAGVEMGVCRKEGMLFLYFYFTEGHDFIAGRAGGEPQLYSHEVGRRVGMNPLPLEGGSTRGWNSAEPVASVAPPLPETNNMALTVEGFTRLTVAEIFAIVKDSLQVPAPIRQRKAVLIRYVMECADAPLRGALEEAVRTRTPDQPLKRKRTDTQFQTRKAQRATEIERDAHDVSKFLELPSKSSVHRCYEDFYNATSDAALKTLVCGICAREVSVQNDGLSTIHMQDLPTHQLTPPVPHPAHDRFRGGMLLEPQGVVVGPSGKDQVWVCGSCRAELAKDRTLPPKFSLANNLWIGRIPWELKKLTFPEQLLIAHIYPRVFVFKLYPKAMGRVQGPATLQRGMRGTVSSYDLNLNAVTAMVEA